MNFETAENDIVTQLTTKVTDNDLTIIAVPEEDTEIQPAFGKRKIIVAFASEDADSDENTSVVIQNTHAIFSVLLQGKKLRGDSGLYSLAEKVKGALIGFIPTDCRELTFSSHKFVKNDKKIFEYVLDFKTQITRVQDVTEPTGPPFVDAVFNEATI